jgi:hypothetical protein
MPRFNRSKKIIRNNKNSKIKKNKINRKYKKSKRNQRGGQPGGKPIRRSSTNSTNSNSPNTNSITSQFSRLTINNPLEALNHKNPNRVPSASKKLSKQIYSKGNQHQKNFDANMKLFRTSLTMPVRRYKFYNKLSEEDKKYFREHNYFPDPRKYYNKPLTGVQAKKTGIPSKVINTIRKEEHRKKLAPVVTEIKAKKNARKARAEIKAEKLLNNNTISSNKLQTQLNNMRNNLKNSLIKGLEIKIRMLKREKK